jgi:hypothetical protein
VVHAFWKIDDESQKQMAQLLFWRNLTFLGAALVIFVLFAAFGHDLAADDYRSALRSQELEARYRSGMYALRVGR